MGRLSGFFAVAMALVYALFLIQRVLYSFLLTETLAAYMGISLLAELVWQRANRWGAFASIAVSMGANFSLYHWRHQRLDYWDPTIFFLSLAAGIVALVVVSLLTPAEDEARVRPFFTKLDTPSDHVPQAAGSQTELPGEHEEGDEWNHDVAPETTRWAAENGRQLLLVNLLHPRRGAAGAGFLKAYRVDLQGLLVGAILSTGLVVGLWALLRL
jgi:hypothetical protein